MVLYHNRETHMTTAMIEGSFALASMIIWARSSTGNVGGVRASDMVIFRDKSFEDEAVFRNCSA